MLKTQHVRVVQTFAKWIFTDCPRILQNKSFHISCNALSGLERKKVRKKKRDPHFYETISPWQTEDDLVKTLTTSNLIYEDDNLVAINKPNCVPMGGAEIEHIPVTANPNEIVRFSIRSIFPSLKEAFRTEYLQPVFSLPRQYSGVMVLVKKENAFATLKAYFRQLRVQGVFAQKYWLVTVGVPKDSSNTVSFAMKKVKVDDDEVSVKVTDYSNQARKRGEVCVGKMQHKVLDKTEYPGGEQAKVALVQLQPTLVKWESIQCYFTDHCMCPVLGDHVYSPRITTVLGKKVKLSANRALSRTQTLPFDVTRALQFSSESLVHHTPLHIHLRELVIPDPRKRKEQITLTAPLPEFFSQTLSLLDLKPEEIKAE